MSMAPFDMAMPEASFKASESSHRGNDHEKQGFLQENSKNSSSKSRGRSNSYMLDCEENREKVHEKPAKESMFSIFEFPKSEPKLNAQEKKIEKEKKKEIERKIKENEKAEKEKKENERKMEKKIKDEEKRIAKEKKKEMDKKIQEDKKIEKERINIEKKKIEYEISQVKAEYENWQKRNGWKRAEHAKLYHSKQDSQSCRDDQLRMEYEWRCNDAMAKYEKDNRIEQLKSKLKALDLQLTKSGEEVLRLYQLKAEDEISKERAREQLRRSMQAENSVAQARQTAQSNEEDLTKKFTLPVVSQEVKSSLGDNPFYAPGEFKYHKMGEWDSDTCKEWIYDSLEDGLVGHEQLRFQLENMPRIRGKHMFGATEEEWVKWLDIQGLLIHDKLQKIAEMKVDM